MKKYLFLILAIFLFPINLFALDLNSKNVYFYNLDKEEVIYEENAYDEISIASMTKIMTCLVAIENIEDLDATVTLTSKDFKGLKEANAATAGFKKGDVVTYRDLLYGLMLPSGADAALALSNNIAGSEEEFVKLMNEKAEELGLKNTHFVNTSGLDADGHYSSAYEVAIILEYALENDTFKEIFMTKQYTTSNSKLKFKSTLAKTSSRYKIDTSYILGSKTGYTYDAGLCLASIAEHNGEQYLLVTAGADYKSGFPHHINDSNEIYQYYFNNYEYVTIMTEGEVIVTLKDVYDNKIEYYAPKSIEMYLLSDLVITSKYTGVETLTTDMKVGDLLGTYEIYAGDDIIYTYNIYLENKIINYPQMILIVAIIILGIIILRKISKRKKRRKRKGKKR